MQLFRWQPRHCPVCSARLLYRPRFGTRRGLCFSDPPSFPAVSGVPPFLARRVPSSGPPGLSCSKSKAARRRHRRIVQRSGSPAGRNANSPGSRRNEVGEHHIVWFFAELRAWHACRCLRVGIELPSRLPTTMNLLEAYLLYQRTDWLLLSRDLIAVARTLRGKRVANHMLGMLGQRAP